MTGPMAAVPRCRNGRRGWSGSRSATPRSTSTQQPPAPDPRRSHDLAEARARPPAIVLDPHQQLRCTEFSGALSRDRRMVASESFTEFLREHLAPLGRVTMRRMFGKTGVFCDGVMFAVVTENTLYVRVDDENRATFKEAESFPPLNYTKKGSTIDLAFWRVPERLFD